MPERSNDTDRLKRLGELVAATSHELNNPLTAIVGLLELLTQGHVVDASVQKKLELILGEAHRAARLVRGLRSISRVVPPAKSEVDLVEVARAIFELKRPLLERAQISLELWAGSNVVVLGDSDQLKQIVLNLVNNAEQALAERSAPRRVWISVRAEGQDGLIDVEDSGAGVPAELASQVFAPFFTTKRRSEGSGLGLSISRAIAENHGGALTLARGTSLGGALFRVRLPLARGARAETRPLDVLAVDDDRFVRDLLQAILAAQGHKATLTADVRAALDALGARATAFDALLLDVRLPDGTGFDVLAAAMARWPDIAHRTIFITAEELHPQHHEQLIESGARLLLKPFSPRGLAQVLATLTAPPATVGGALAPGERGAGAPPG